MLLGRRKRAKEKVNECSEGGHAEGWCDRMYGI